MLGTGMRPSEIFALRWEHAYLNGQGGLLEITQASRGQPGAFCRRYLPFTCVHFEYVPVEEKIFSISYLLSSSSVLDALSLFRARMIYTQYVKK